MTFLFTLGSSQKYDIKGAIVHESSCWKPSRKPSWYVLNTLVHNSPALILGVLVAAVIQVYVDPEKMKGWLMRRSSVSIPATVAFGAFTPFCACGTMAVVLSMLATSLPWGPVMAFLVSSPLMSPEEFVMMSGILGPAFAIAVDSGLHSARAGLRLCHARHREEDALSGQSAALLRLGQEEAEKEAGCGCSAGGNQGNPALTNAACCAQQAGRRMR